MNYKLLFSAMIIFFIATAAKSQELTMFPGFFGYQYYQDENKLSKNDFESILYQDEEAESSWKKSKRHVAFSVGCLVAEIGFGLWAIDRANINKSTTLPMIGFFGAAGASIGFTFSSLNLRKKAILKYNSNQEVSSINLGPTGNGMGLVLSF